MEYLTSVKRRPTIALFSDLFAKYMLASLGVKLLEMLMTDNFFATENSDYISDRAE